MFRKNGMVRIGEDRGLVKPQCFRECPVCDMLSSQPSMSAFRVVAEKPPHSCTA